MIKIRYFENDKMSKLETAIMEALKDLNESMVDSIAEGFTDVSKPKALHDCLLNAFREMIEIDLKD